MQQVRDISRERVAWVARAGFLRKCVWGGAAGCALLALGVAGALAAGPAAGPAAGTEPPAQKPPSAEQAPPQAAPQAPAAGPPASIEGFREAHFGMTEEQVRQAVRKDFPTVAAKLKAAVNPSEKTTVLSLTAPDLLAGTGTAQISYLLGYKSKKLTQVNIVWASEGTEQSDESIVGTANSLRQYFSAENYKQESVVANRQVSAQTIIVFRAIDQRDRTVLLVLSGAGTALRNKAKGAKPPPFALELSYIADAAHPDVFRIAKGQF